ncbi:Sec63 complex subunit [Martiniozyma asiatica (nom. inval.)]|nr:Sec63 complex subunit [Martiniozyma asiatica]
MSTPQLANAPPGSQGMPPMQNKDPKALALATAIRYNKCLKQRQGILTSSKNRSDFFRYKRWERAMQSDEYLKLQLKKPDLLPIVKTKEDLQKVFVVLIKNQMVIPVIKLSTKVAKDRGITIDKQTPAIEPTNKATLTDDEYYVWNFTPANPLMPLYSLLAIIVVFGLILFPLWPIWMRQGVWWISNTVLVFLGLLLALGVVRGIIYLITLIFMKRQFWLFPNLFADVGVIESFKPLYEWEEPSTKGKKSNKNKAVTSSSQIEEKKVSSNSAKASSVKPSANTIKKRVATVEEVVDDE